VSLGSGLLAPAAATLTACGLVLCGCGTAPQAARPAPPAPVDMSVYVSARAVSVSPAALGAGPVRLLIASEAPMAVMVLVVRRGPMLVAQSGAIAPGANRQLSVELRPGVYRLAALRVAHSQAQLALPSPIRPAHVLVGAPRASSGDALAQP